MKNSFEQLQFSINKDPDLEANKFQIASYQKNFLLKKAKYE